MRNVKSRVSLSFQEFLAGKRTINLITTVLLFSACYLLPILSNAQPGSLDPTFGIGGKIATDFGSVSDFGRAIAIQSDGKILVAGQSSNGSNDDFGLVRYNNDGTLDNTFDSDGKVTTSIGSADDRGRSVAIQSDGKIVVAGYSDNGSDIDFVLVRYNSDGTLDSSFNSDGKVTTAIGPGDDVGQLVAIQSDDKIVVAGYSNNGFDFDLGLVRYNSDGSLDNGFGLGGKVTTAIGSADDVGESVAIQSDGKIVVAGFSSNGSDIDFALVRYNGDGSLDNAFGSGGKVTTNIGGGDDAGYSVAIQSDDKIVVAGNSNNGSDFDFALARYNSNGSLDNSFGSGGKITTAIGSADDISNSITIQSDGKIVVAGYSDNGSDLDFALLRYNSDGSLDNAFGSGGKVTTDFGGFSDRGYSVAIQSDDKIVVAGYSNNGIDNDFAVARYNGGNGVGIAENIAHDNTITPCPNPFTTELIVNGTTATGELILFDITGNEILREKTFSSETKINTEKLLPGFYLLNYKEGNKIENMTVVKF